ncbi:MAG TPA: hypothetical protein VFC96_07830 [Anaerovoracaceae bacterium]|nr:hypothetical protein [Anaerovoracaceae bacterium]
MNRALITFNEKEAREKAEQYFIRYCGLDLKVDKYIRMYTDAIKVRDDGIEGIQLSALISSFGPEVFSNRKIVYEGNEIYCEAFNRIPKENVKKVYLYIITAGECTFDPDDAIIKQLYADIWGTVYVDVGRDLLERVIEVDAENSLRDTPGGGGFLSTPISPGFFGMRTEESKNINAILSGEEIGISVRDNGIMLPLKTCSGLYLVVDDPDEMPEPECKDCIGSAGGCSLCKVMTERKRDNV